MVSDDQCAGRGQGETAADRRRETRYPIEAKVIVRRQNGEAIAAMARNISASGMRLHFDQEDRSLAFDEEVTVEVELQGHPDKAFSAWGLGRVAHLDRTGAGVQLYAGHFDPPPEMSET